MAMGFAWRYRASKAKSVYQPELDHTRFIELLVWGVPAAMICLFATLVWKRTHELDPYRPLGQPGGQTVIQAVAQNWKWLFVYPDLGIASVNEFAFPVDKPISLQITSDVAMNAFMIPGLGGQIYAMAGMETRLNLQAVRPGRYQGRNMQYTGKGFPAQTFDAIALSGSEYAAWIAKVRESPDRLTAATYGELAAPSVGHPVTYYAVIEPGIFHKIIGQYDARTPEPMRDKPR
jgi:cytochrome o ubiquinol oxidase subunit II